MPRADKSALAMTGVQILLSQSSSLFEKWDGVVVGILNDNYSVYMEGLFAKMEEKLQKVYSNDLEMGISTVTMKVLVISSGGVIISFSQQRGSEFSALPG